MGNGCQQLFPAGVVGRVEGLATGADQCSGMIAHGIAYPQGHSVLSGDFHCPGMNHFSSLIRHLKNFVIMDFVQHAGLGNHAGVCCHDAVDIGVDFHIRCL